jgi:hypothetical protein
MNFRHILWTVGMGYATFVWPAAMVLPHSASCSQHHFSEQPSAMASGVCSPTGLSASNGEPLAEGYRTFASAFRGH